MVGRLHPGQCVSRDGLPGRLDIDIEKPRAVQAKDLLPVPGGEGLVAELRLECLRDLEAPECLDLPLG